LFPTHLGHKISPYIKTSSRITLSIIHIASPICIRVTCNHKICFSKIPNAMKKSIINIPDDTLDCSEVRLFRICLKLSTDSNIEGNIWSASCKVEKTPDHTSVESRINLLACKISTDLDTCDHGSMSMTLPI
jgi:hypothetical protein